jgi:fructoselysine-6-phosphate deglycase
VLNFDPERYVRLQTGAVQLAEPLRQAVRERLAAGATNLFFIGTGGVAFLMQPAAQLLEARSTFPVFTPRATDIVLTGHASLGPDSVVVVPSVSGTTKESVAAVDYVRARGAHVISLVGTEDSPLARNAHQTFVNPVADDTSSESFYLQSLLVALAVMDARGEIEDYDRTVAQLQQLPELLVGVKDGFEQRAADFALEIKDEQHHIMTAGGSAWFEAWYYGMCILEEMQWIWTRPVEASDFFHGTLELLESDTSVIIFKGEDEGRALSERVERFAATVSEKVRVFDTADLPLPGIDADVRALVSPVLLAAVLERVSAHLEVLRDHALTTRRYYKKGDF